MPGCQRRCSQGRARALRRPPSPPSAARRGRRPQTPRPPRPTCPPAAACRRVARGAPRPPVPPATSRSGHLTLNLLKLPPQTHLHNKRLAQHGIHPLQGKEWDVNPRGCLMQRPRTCYKTHRFSDSQRATRTEKLRRRGPAPGAPSGRRRPQRSKACSACVRPPQPRSPPASHRSG